MAATSVTAEPSSTLKQAANPPLRGAQGFMVPIEWNGSLGDNMGLTRL